MKRTTKEDIEIIGLIAERAVGMAVANGHVYDRFSAIMDIESAHEDVGLRLDDLLAADDFNFAHDVFGIRRHLDRTEFPGKLTDCFRPRFSIPASAGRTLEAATG